MAKGSQQREMRTLVVTLGQLRAHQVTWANFKEKVLDQLSGDLAVCVGADDHLDIANPFYRNARYRWVVPVQAALPRLFDRIQALLGVTMDWRMLGDIPGTWLGRVMREEKPPGVAMPYLLRWFMLDNIRAAGLDYVYDRFVVTRSDYFYLCPHPPLECLEIDKLWLPDGEDYGGLMDKHLVVSAAQLRRSCNLLDEILGKPDRMRNAMADSPSWNIEQAIHLHLETNGLLTKIRRFPYVMCLVRSPDDPTDRTAGTYIPDLGITIRYPSEFNEASRYRELLDTNEKWKRYFASAADGDRRPARLFTTHGTVFYLDETSGEVRHGPVGGSSRNLLFHWRDGSGEIVHHPKEGGETVIVVDPATAGLRVSRVGLPVTFELVPIAKGFGIDQTLMTNNLVGLRANGVFLCAQEDGSVRLDRPHCYMWEHFRIVPAS
ncbi:MAG: hypothetical protein U1E60_19825 [Reyranellaceae bacterium]